MKSIIIIYELFIKFLYKIINNKNIIAIPVEPIYVGDLVPSIASYKRVIEKYEKGIKEGEFHEEPHGADFNYPDW